MPGTWGNLGLYKSRPAGLGSFAKPRESPGGYSGLELTDVLETHINLSCCLRCLMKVTGICNKINVRFDSYSFICVLSYLLSQEVERFYKFLTLTFPVFPCFFYHIFSFIFHFIYFKNILPRDHSILIYLHNNLNT